MGNACNLSQDYNSWMFTVSLPEESRFMYENGKGDSTFEFGLWVFTQFFPSQIAHLQDLISEALKL